MIVLKTPLFKHPTTEDQSAALIKELLEIYGQSTVGVYEKILTLPYKKIRLLSDQLPMLIMQFNLVSMIIIRRTHSNYYVGGAEQLTFAELIYLSGNTKFTPNYVCDIEQAIFKCAFIAPLIKMPADSTLIRPFVYSPLDIVLYYDLIDKTRWPVHWSTKADDLTPRIMRPRDYSCRYPEMIMRVLYEQKGAALLRITKSNHPICITWHSPSTPFDVNGTYVYYIKTTWEEALQKRLKAEQDLEFLKSSTVDCGLA